LLPSAQSPGARTVALEQPGEYGEDVFRRPLTLTPLPRGDIQSLSDRQRRKKVPSLGDQPDTQPGHTKGSHAGYVGVLEQDGSVPGWGKPYDRAKQRCFSCSVPSEDGHGLPLLDPQG